MTSSELARFNAPVGNVQLIQHHKPRKTAALRGSFICIQSLFSEQYFVIYRQQSSIYSKPSSFVSISFGMCISFIASNICLHSPASVSASSTVIVPTFPSAFIDNGGHRTNQVYKFCKAKFNRNIFAIEVQTTAQWHTYKSQKIETVKKHMSLKLELIWEKASLWIGWNQKSWRKTSSRRQKLGAAGCTPWPVKMLEVC